MDLKGSLVDTNVRIYPTNGFLEYIKKIKDDKVPENILKLKNGSDYETKCNVKDFDYFAKTVNLTNEDIELLRTIKKTISRDSAVKVNKTEIEPEFVEHDKIKTNKTKTISKNVTDNDEKLTDKKESIENSKSSNNTIGNDSEADKNKGTYLTTSDVYWLYQHLQQRRINGETVPYLHELLEGARIEMPGNKVLKRNPVLEARCVKLRAQQEAREYRKMTKGVDNVRMRFPEDSISYQLKQVNRQLIAIGQFIISIFAGFLFGFKGVEWMIGSLDFGFRLLLGVMCALVIALAEIYFLAKKLNEELNIPETVQLGGPPKFVDAKKNEYLVKEPKKSTDKEHQE